MKNVDLESQFEEMSLLFKMFSDSTRLKILNLLFEKERCVSDFIEELQMSQSAVSHQLASLKKTHLIKSRKAGKNVYYSLADEHIESIFKMALDHVNE
ncbi:ArsR/SmtB family transcription factor [Anaerorhabdus sp.]|uniref:ArsR/SmtB family transcription factor n=1 Tax=Anaerorhabdus sp. TaxID=1872524 RepID=UPI002B217991|nr:metalloregulator ArsR/SmtB family transcription factor [Anaerorhabdus sp.]MEA4873910.1 metalloregulator ArsR/SmtB family transcription factor [Anaerorhabdus sp.]